MTDAGERTKSAGRPTSGWISSMPEVRVGVSSCLVGQPVRYDGGHKADAVVQALGTLFRLIPICPEVEAGMGAPREPVRLVDWAEGTRMVGVDSNRDWTGAMHEFASTRIPRLAKSGLKGYILKSSSPSCALGDLAVYGRDGSVRRTGGRGLFAQMLVYKLPMMPVEEETALQDFQRAASFVDEVLGYDRLLRFVQANPARTDLVRFHAGHELTLVSRGSQHYRRLAHLAASGRGGSTKEILVKYAHAFMQSLKLPASRANHARTLRRVSFQLQSSMPESWKRELDRVIDRYAQGAEPLSAPVALVKRHMGEGRGSWLAQQSYFQPCPPEVLLEEL